MAEKTDRMALRLRPGIKDALTAAAQADHRKFSALAELILEEWLRKHGWLKGSKTR